MTKKQTKTAILITALLPSIALSSSPAIDPVQNYSVDLKLKKQNRDAIADYLGWVDHDINYCGGYYVEPLLTYEQTDNKDQAPLHISTDVVDYSQEDRSQLLGNVTITQADRFMRADKVFLNRNKQTGKVESVDLTGKVQLREPGKMLISNNAHINIDNDTGILDQVLYRFSSDRLVNARPDIPSEEQMVIVDQLTAWGVAQKVKRDESGVLHIYQGTYTTCPIRTNTWLVRANSLNLNRESGRGSATGAKLYMQQVPLLYIPYMNFPIDDRRKTGLLFPSAGHTTNSGYNLAVPFYWNIAPNYDATITPNFMTERGIQWNGLFRYLRPHHEGDIHGSMLIDDREFTDFKRRTLEDTPIGVPSRSRLEKDNNDRYFISYNDVARYNPHWSSYVYLNYASDDYYFEDFKDDPAQTIDNQIHNVMDLYYNSQHWSFTGRLEAYQTLHPVSQDPVANQYRKLPELILNGHYPNGPMHTDIQLNNSVVYFNKLENPGEIMDPVTGTRLNVNPGVGIPNYWVWGFFNPNLQIAATQYDLRNQVLDNKGREQSSSITRVLPILNIDTGLFFDRDTQLFRVPYTQTLEPRLFYLYVPYENQNDIPLFDTALQPFTYEQLFRTNRFSGIDRISDANQISMALTSRYLAKDTGIERVRASIGQTVYFRHQKVVLDDVKADLAMLENSVDPTSDISPLVGQLVVRISDYWRLLSNIAYDPNDNEINNGNFTFQYRRDDAHIINLGLSFLQAGDPLMFTDPTASKNDLYQFDSSAFWPLSEHWSAMARWNYNISHKNLQNAFAGFQYDSCCWAIRLLGGREFNNQQIDYETRSSKPDYNDQVYVEFALKGLGNVGANSPRMLLTRGIPGYMDHFGS